MRRNDPVNAELRKIAYGSHIPKELTIWTNARWRGREHLATYPRSSQFELTLDGAAENARPHHPTASSLTGKNARWRLGSHS